MNTNENDPANNESSADIPETVVNLSDNESAPLLSSGSTPIPRYGATGNSSLNPPDISDATSLNVDSSDSGEDLSSANWEIGKAVFKNMIKEMFTSGITYGPALSTWDAVYGHAFGELPDDPTFMQKLGKTAVIAPLMALTTYTMSTFVGPMLDGLLNINLQERNPQEVFPSADSSGESQDDAEQIVANKRNDFTTIQNSLRDGAPLPDVTLSGSIAAGDYLSSAVNTDSFEQDAIASAITAALFGAALTSYMLLDNIDGEPAYEITESEGALAEVQKAVKMISESEKDGKKTEDTLRQVGNHLHEFAARTAKHFTSMGVENVFTSLIGNANNTPLGALVSTYLVFHRGFSKISELSNRRNAPEDLPAFSDTKRLVDEIKSLNSQDSLKKLLKRHFNTDNAQTSTGKVIGGAAETTVDILERTHNVLSAAVALAPAAVFDTVKFVADKCMGAEDLQEIATDVSRSNSAHSTPRNESDDDRDSPTLSGSNAYDNASTDNQQSSSTDIVESEQIIPKFTKTPQTARSKFTEKELTSVSGHK